MCVPRDIGSRVKTHTPTSHHRTPSPRTLRTKNVLRTICTPKFEFSYIFF
ncbi:Cell death abnormality protein 1 [Caenorhabditis elegans]|uniref:Isoform d of Cell death abnormality protein 1 n=1 Tax=Caenorhabditis elegans TaxID=6239 RepID=Q9XWD6-4|nr:Cell death abnormality protein 1 [Caenorhabditis elegans]CAL44979.1 Cell death abnormality protein 1 [Caenorhabditis elegans]|eukprot:NP_001076621.1 Cell death abnormality protein 1 [Caenorhabditis elegans]